MVYTADAICTIDIKGYISITIEIRILLVNSGSKVVEVDSCVSGEIEGITDTGATYRDFNGIGVIWSINHIAVILIGSYCCTILNAGPCDGGGYSHSLGQLDGRCIIVVLAILEASRRSISGAYIAVAISINSGKAQLVAIANVLVYSDGQIDKVGSRCGEGNTIFPMLVLTIMA